MTRPAHLERLIDMHSFCRPAGSKTERRFISEYLRPLDMEQDKAGNLIKRIGANPSVMFSSHTDTVHRKGGLQTLKVKDNVLSSVASNCLGADDTVGVWLMAEMILADRPGLYVFHRAEEVGGIGSSYIAEKTPELLEGIDAAVALDRKGRTSIITHQWGGRCASDAFATSLNLALGSGFIGDDGGTFTDTANYMDHVPECTNLSVGYFDQHTSKESLDLDFAMELRERLIALDTRKLVVARDPLDYEQDAWTSHLNDQSPGKHTAASDFDRMVDVIKRNPRETADMLESFGITLKELEQDLWVRGAILDL